MTRTLKMTATHLMPRTRTVEQLLRPYDADVGALALEARRVVRKLLPKVEEGVDGSAPLIAYHYGPGYRGMVCTLILSQSGVKLGLVRGRELDDPDGLLRGSGKVHRHIPLRVPSDLRQRGVARLVKGAHAAWKKRTASAR